MGRDLHRRLGEQLEQLEQQEQLEQHSSRGQQEQQWATSNGTKTLADTQATAGSQKG